MSELDDFLTKTLAIHNRAAEGMHNGAPSAWLEMWSRADPVTVFAALGPTAIGWDAVSRNFRWAASKFSRGAEFTFDVVTAGVSGDLAYTAGYERSLVSIDGGPIRPNTVRVTHIYRREDGEWKMVHRHGAFAPVDESPHKEASTVNSTMYRSGQPSYAASMKKIASASNRVTLVGPRPESTNAIRACLSLTFRCLKAIGRAYVAGARYNALWISLPPPAEGHLSR